MSVAAVNVSRTSPTVEPQTVPNWKTIAVIAACILASCTVLFSLYLAIPASVSIIVLPTLAIASAISLFFWNKSSAEAAPVEIPPSSAEAVPDQIPASSVFPPRGLVREGFNCWLNTLLQVIRCDQKIREWFEGVPKELGDHLAQIPFVPQPFIGPRVAPTPNQLNEINAIVAQVPNSELYAYVLARGWDFTADPIAKRQKKWNLLVRLKQYMDVYNRAEKNGLEGPLNFSTQDFRRDLHQIMDSISADAWQQGDPIGPLCEIINQLMPYEFTAFIEKRTYFHLDGNPRIRHRNALPGGDGYSRREPIPFIPIGVREDSSNRVLNLRDLLDWTMNNATSPDLFPLNGEDGVKHEYRLRTEQQQFVQAPASLWLRISKHNANVDVQDTLEIQPIEGDLARYKLDSYAVHTGTNDSGHYRSYKLVNNAWYEMDDARVRRLNAQEEKALRDKAIILHYSGV